MADILNHLIDNSGEVGRYAELLSRLEFLHGDENIRKIFVEVFYNRIIELFSDLYTDIDVTDKFENPLLEELNKMVTTVCELPESVIVVSADEAIRLLSNQGFLDKFTTRGEVPNPVILLEGGDGDGKIAQAITIYSNFTEAQVELEDFNNPHPYLTRLGAVSTIMGSFLIQYFLIGLYISNLGIELLYNFNLVPSTRAADSRKIIENKDTKRIMKLITTVAFDEILEYLASEPGVELNEFKKLASRTYVHFLEKDLMTRTISKIALMFLGGSYAYKGDRIEGQSVKPVNLDEIIDLLNKT